MANWHPDQMRGAQLTVKSGARGRTSSSHIAAIYCKLNISSRAAATYQAARMGLIAGKV